MFSYFREESKVVCLTESTDSDFTLNVPLNVSLVWASLGVAVGVNASTFTYKPDPEITSIDTDVTIVR